MTRQSIRTLILSGFFLALGLVLPFLTGQVPVIGSRLLPMHLPVLLCGFICGGPAGALVGLILPVFRSLLFGMPPMFPIALAMSLEMAAYGWVSGVMYRRLGQKPINLYLSLLVAMLAGRVVWGLATWAFMSLSGAAFTWQLFAAGAFINAVPGIIIQLVLVPALVLALNRQKAFPVQEHAGS